MVPFEEHAASSSTTKASILPQQVRQAVAYLRANYRERITLKGLAHACAVSERTLLRQFRSCIGVSPLMHLHRIRLSAARADLLRGTISVTEVVSRCGLSHLGRFASDYRRAFGEHPSTTRARARQQVACQSTNFATVARALPSLWIAPWDAESRDERIVAQDLTDQVRAALSRTRVASVRSAESPARASVGTSRQRVAGGEARYCLQGRLTRRGERVRVTLWLLDTADGCHIWGDSLDGIFGAMLNLQDRVVRAALSGVVPGILGAELRRIDGADPELRTGRDMAMQAYRLLLKTDADSVRTALAIAQHAMQVDPDDALPVAFAACAQARLSIRTTPPTGAHDLALDLARRAGVLDVGEPLVTTARAAVASALGQRDEAEALSARALAMDPTSGWAWERRAIVVGWDNPSQAIGYYRRALELHGPFMPQENCFFGIALAHDAAGRVSEAARWVHRALAENPSATFLYQFAAYCASRLGHLAEARRSGEKLLRAYPELTISGLARAGLIERAECADFLARAGIPL
jgi:AraC-like DNA-binding protein/tetratricopeptide (TPR) repeat protein